METVLKLADLSATMYSPADSMWWLIVVRSTATETFTDFTTKGMHRK